jgi:hypothetical protein
MKLTPYQLNSLRLSRQARHTGYPLMKVLRASRARFLYLAALATFIALGCWWFGMPEVALFSLAMVAGVLLRDIGMLRVSARLWPVNVAITDWKRVDELIAENSDQPS